MTARKIGIDRNGKPVLPNTRLPDEHYQPGDTAEVVFEGAVGTIRPKDYNPDADDEPYTEAEFAEAAALYEKLATTMDLVCTDGEYRFVKKP